jgi:hypothetical protein
MNDIFKEINFYYILAGALGLIVLFQIRQQAINRSRFFKIWDSFAHTVGLEFSNSSQRKPFGELGHEITGKYQGKVVKVSANYLGVFGRRQALLNFNLLVENPSTDKLPAGAFLVIRRNPQVFGLWNRLRMSLMGEDEDMVDLKDRYQIHGIPKNLGNFIFRQEVAKKLIQRKGMLDLHINRRDLSYSLIGYIHDRGFLQQILDDLQDLAVIFERFARNWL